MPTKKAPNTFVSTVCQGIHVRPKTKMAALKIDPIAPPLATSSRNFQSIEKE
jgi:hypothetical protein